MSAHRQYEPNREWATRSVPFTNGNTAKAPSWSIRWLPNWRKLRVDWGSIRLTTKTALRCRLAGCNCTCARRVPGYCSWHKLHARYCHAHGERRFWRVQDLIRPLAGPTEAYPVLETITSIRISICARRRTLIAYTFAGDSLTVADGGRFLFKGTSATAPITINNLILDGGYLRNAQGNAWLLAGSIHLTANGGIVWPSSGAGGTNIASNVDGIGPLAIGGADSGDQSGQVNTLSGTNTYTGPTLLLGGTVTLTGPGALPSGAVLKFGSATPNANSGRATLNLNGGSYTVGSLSVATYSAVTANGTIVTPATNGTKVVVHFTTLPTGIQIGQLVTRGGSTAYVTGIDYSTNDVLLGETSGITTAGAFTFSATNPAGGSQVITNNSTATPSTLTFAGGSTASVFDGVINQGTGASTALTVSSGSLALQRASGYTGATTLSGGTLKLDFNTSGSPANNVINAASPLVLAGGTLALNSTTSTTTTADLQTFASTSLTGGSAVQLTANNQPNSGPRNSIALNLGRHYAQRRNS